MQKNNSRIRALAAGHVSQGYDVAEVTANITAKNRPQDRTVLKELGGHWMDLQDVQNSATMYNAATPPPRIPNESNLGGPGLIKLLFLFNGSWNRKRTRVNRKPVKPQLAAAQMEKLHGLCFRTSGTFTVACKSRLFDIDGCHS